MTTAKPISVLGATGSIGASTLDIVRGFPERFRVVSLSCHQSVEQLAEQIREFRPDRVCVGSETDAGDLRATFPELEVCVGEVGLVRLASEPARWQRKMPTQPLSEIDVPDHFDGKQAEQSAIGRELKDRIEEAMERLTERQSTALHLRAVEGMDYASISEVMGCSSAAARMHVLEARNKVLARVKEHLDT